MSIKEIFQPIIDRLEGTAGVKTIYGDPVEVKGKTIIPVATVAYGFGAGSGTRGKKGESKDQGEGGGGGGGVTVRPKGVIEITGADTRFIPFNQTKKLALVLMLGLFLGILLTRK